MGKTYRVMLLPPSAAVPHLFELGEDWAMQIRVAIAVSDDAIKRVREVVNACDLLGFRANSIVSQVGIITGSIEADRLAELRAIPGVAAVERERAGRIHDAPTRK
jgi:hypothetical protein